MPEFDAIGRDVAAAADSTFEPAVAGAVKAVWAAAGFDQGDNPNHLWTVSADLQPDQFTITASVKDANVYAPPAYPDAPATAEELNRAAVEAADAATTEAPVEAPAPVAPVDITSAPNADATVTAISTPVDVQVTPAPAESDAPAA